MKHKHEPNEVNLTIADSVNSTNIEFKTISSAFKYLEAKGYEILFTESGFISTGKRIDNNEPLLNAVYLMSKAKDANDNKDALVYNAAEMYDIEVYRPIQRLKMWRRIGVVTKDRKQKGSVFVDEYNNIVSITSRAERVYSPELFYSSDTNDDESYSYDEAYSLMINSFSKIKGVNSVGDSKKNNT